MRNLALAAVLALSTAAAGADVSLQGKPAVRSEAGGVRIEFALAAPADVEVAIVGEKGEVLRHLAAGVVGAEKAAPPLAPASCTQSLIWDRKDDEGRAVAGKTTVRIRAGMKPALGRIIGDPARLTGKVYGLATDEKGDLYVASGGVYDNAPVFSIKVFDRSGKYLRTILPMSAGLAADQAKEYGDAREVAGRLVPGNFHALSPYVQQGGIVAFLGNQVRDGMLWLLNTEGAICRIRTDGSPVAWKSGAKTVQPSGGPMCWAVSPDGRTLFLAGWWGRDGAGDGVVKKIDPATGKAQDFLSVDPAGNQAWVKEPNGWYHFKNWGRKNGLAALHGLAVDRDGRLCVCDRVKGRLAVYDDTGKLVGSTPVEFPDLVATSPADPTVYVCTRKVIDGYKAINEFRVIKLSQAAGGRVLAEVTLKGANAPLMAVDAAARPAVIWLSNVVDDKDPQGKQGTRLVRIEDRGGELVVTGRLNEGLPPAGGVVKVFADPATDDVYVNDGWSGLSRYDGLSGAGGPIPITAIDLAVGPDRNLYLYGRKGWNEPIYRCDAAFRPVPFSGTAKPETTLTTLNKTVYGRYGTGWSNKGLCVAPDGKIYVRHMYEWCKYHVTAFGPDGRAIKGGRVADGVLGPLDDQSGGLKVDRAGNFYVGCNETVKGGPALRPLEGCVVKVGPGGGGLAAKRGDADGLQLGKSFFEGAVTVYPHLAPRTSGGCVCKEARFDLDDYGRLYVPDVHDFCIRVYDNAANLVCTLGGYGNADARGGGAAASPEIPFGWPMTCGINGAGRLYVGDVLNQRIVRVDLGYAAEVLVPVE
jgi:DNA-binding beta-propeller fold protein YncE